MKLKSITFRCSEAQNNRINNTLLSRGGTRTELICAALDSFLNYASDDARRSQDLFELVQGIDTASTGPRFAEQA